MCCNADSNETATSKLAGPRYSARCLTPSHRVAMRSLAELVNLFATPSGSWRRELLSAKPIAGVREGSRNGPSLFKDLGHGFDGVSASFHHFRTACMAWS